MASADTVTTVTADTARTGPSVPRSTRTSAASMPASPAVATPDPGQNKRERPIRRTVGWGVSSQLQQRDGILMGAGRAQASTHRGGGERIRALVPHQ